MSTPAKNQEKQTLSNNKNESKNKAKKDNSNKNTVLSCKDYLVSKEVFELNLDKAYQMLITNPIPKDLNKYYQSENYISHTDSKKTLTEKIYQVVKKYALKKKLNLIDKEYLNSEKEFLKSRKTISENSLENTNKASAKNSETTLNTKIKTEDFLENFENKISEKTSSTSNKFYKTDSPVEKIKHKNSKTILDIGTGTGDFLQTCKNNNWKVFGTEPNQKAREIAAKKGIHLECSLEAFTDKKIDATRTSDTKIKFDTITLWHVLEHIENLKETIQILKSLLNKNGTLIIAVPNYKSFDAAHYKNYWAAYDTPRHLWHFSKYSIKKTIWRSKHESNKNQTDAF